VASVPLRYIMNAHDRRCSMSKKKKKKKKEKRKERQTAKAGMGNTQQWVLCSVSSFAIKIIKIIKIYKLKN
jgi:hypothetical protein